MITYYCKRCNIEVQAPKDSIVRCKCKRIMKVSRHQRVTKNILKAEKTLNFKHQGIHIP